MMQFPDNMQFPYDAIPSFTFFDYVAYESTLMRVICSKLH